MNSFIETLNQWGGNFLSFAWPMLWQSSLLIAFVFALDFLSARKIRASIRYALWLVVLVKLCLPPTLGYADRARRGGCFKQSGRRGSGRHKIRRHLRYHRAANGFRSANRPGSPRRNRSWTVPAGRCWVSISVSAGLLLWLVFRWRQISRKVGNATLNTELNGAL